MALFKFGGQTKICRLKLPPNKLCLQYVEDAPLLLAYEKYFDKYITPLIHLHNKSLQILILWLCQQL